eukprot:TRINITY_DN18256_c0_g2_i2.p1 TRINITY_DN18256_c0_g2~~TRINITY_DN18256_c0_g2_i2.p1  ORF type:complete len:388 (-),score=82.67 TRINITY_DN18256_c0_g2_i2:299-1432(-)
MASTSAAKKERAASPKPRVDSTEKQEKKDAETASPAPLFGKGSLYHCVQVGARLAPLECLLVYTIPVFFFASSYSTWFLWNGACQLLLFLAVVQVPAYLTGHMAYVDLGWPIGLVLLAVNGLVWGDGFWLRRWGTGLCMLLHGGRMACGALVMFFPYRWEQDLPRYRYAKVRFMGKDGMPERLWPLKVQHDTLQQAFANCTILACPVMLAVFDKTAELGALEIVGWVLWAASWIWENLADGQMQLFLMECKKKQDKTAVLGYAPYDGMKYFIWTLCRHPNYFGEWMAWNAFVLMGLPCVARLEEALVVKLGFSLTLFFTSRIFYDCLNYWTGAEPAEYYSVQKRKLYREYQKKTRVFFPFEMPFVDHCREPGWPELK